MNKKTQSLLLSAIMGSLAYILMYFSFPVMPALPFLKIDFSDIPILLVAFVEGPLGALFAGFVGKFLHYLFTGGEMGIPIGDFTSFIASMAYVLPIYYMLNKPLRAKLFGWQNDSASNASMLRVIGGYILATLSLTVTMSILNYFIITPFYIHVMNFPIDNMRTYILYGIVPFNIIKGALVSLVSHVMVVKLLPTLVSRFGFSTAKRRHS